MSEIPEDIDRIATDIVRSRTPEGTDPEWHEYKLIAEALLAERMKERERCADSLEKLGTALQEIAQWSDAYPTSVFPKPDLVKVRSLLEAGGLTLDAVSADAMRHVVEGVGRIAKAALSQEKPATD